MDVHGGGDRGDKRWKEMIEMERGDGDEMLLWSPTCLGERAGEELLEELVLRGPQNQDDVRRQRVPVLLQEAVHAVQHLATENQDEDDSVQHLATQNQEEDDSLEHIVTQNQDGADVLRPIL